LAIFVIAYNGDIEKKIKDWAIADSIILATARKLSAKVVSGDSSLKNVREAIMI
jgi:hypothetical protein